MRQFAYTMRTPGMSENSNHNTGSAAAENARAAVEAHLRGLARAVAHSAGDLEGIRRLIDTYSHVDPSVCVIQASSVAVTVGGVPCEWVLPENSETEVRMMYIHGGSWMSGSLAGYRAHAGRLAESTGCAVLTVGYRLAPEHAFPAGLEDCDCVLDWLMENGPHGQSPPRAVLVAGDSAGANLALALMIKRRDLDKPLPRGTVALSPATDLTWSGASLTERAQRDPVLRPERLDLVVQAYLQGNTTPENPYVSPLFGDLRGLPPLLIQIGEAEILYDDAVRFARKAEQAGVEVRLETYPEMPHVFQMFAPFLPQASEALASIGRFVTRQARRRGEA